MKRLLCIFLLIGLLVAGCHQVNPNYSQMLNDIYYGDNVHSYSVNKWLTDDGKEIYTFIRHFEQGYYWDIDDVEKNDDLGIVCSSVEGLLDVVSSYSLYGDLNIVVNGQVGRVIKGIERENFIDDVQYTLLFGRMVKAAPLARIFNDSRCQTRVLNSYMIGNPVDSNGVEFDESVFEFFYLNRTKAYLINRLVLSDSQKVCSVIPEVIMEINAIQDWNVHKDYSAVENNDRRFTVVKLEDLPERCKEVLPEDCVLIINSALIHNCCLNINGVESEKRLTHNEFISFKEQMAVTCPKMLVLCDTNNW